jgi:hypothetical protein
MPDKKKPAAKKPSAKKRGGDSGAANPVPHDNSWGARFANIEPQNPVNQGDDVYATVTPPLGSFPTWNTTLQQLGGRKKPAAAKSKPKPKPKKK